MPEQKSTIHFPAELLAFYKDLKNIWDNRSTECRLTFEDTCKHEQDDQFPLLQKYQPVFEPEQLCETFGQICSLVALYKPELRQYIDEISKMPQESLHNLINEAIIGQDNSYQNTHADRTEKKEVLNFVVNNTIKPFLMLFANQVVKKEDKNEWKEKLCPVCGRYPILARLSHDDGKKYLICSFCNTEWSFKRLACHNCGNEDHFTLSSLIIEETPGYHLDICEACKGYLKIIDQRVCQHADFSLAEVQTIHLDMIARQRGYGNKFTNA